MNYLSAQSMPSLVALTVSLYSGYVFSSWLYQYVTTPSTNYRLLAAKKKGKTANFNDIPGPVGYPFLGSFLLFLPYVRVSRFDQFINDMNKKYNGIFKFQMDQTMVVVEDAAMAKKIVNSPDIFVRDERLAYAMSDMAPTALFTLPTGEQWRKHRKTLQPAFGPVHLRHAFACSLEFVDKLLDIWEKYPTRDVMTDFSLLTGDVIAKVAFSMDLGALEGLVNNSPIGFFEHFDLLLGVLPKRFTFFNQKFIWGLVGVDTKSIDPSVQFMKKKLGDIINERRSKKQATDVSKNFEVDLLDRLISSESQFSESEIFDEVFGFFLAGHETTANLLTWTMLELTKHPEIYEKLAAEVKSVLAGDKLTLDSLNSLKYVDAVIKESLRFHPIVTFIPRATAVDCELTDSDGFTIAIPKGVQMSFNLVRLHMSEAFWGSDAHLFKPERWDNGFVPIPGSFLPFSDGPHNCIGQKMALIEAKVALTRIVERFKSVSISPKQGPIEPITTITHGLKHGLLVDVVKR